MTPFQQASGHPAPPTAASATPPPAHDTIGVPITTATVHTGTPTTTHRPSALTDSPFDTSHLGV